MITTKYHQRFIVFGVLLSLMLMSCSQVKSAAYFKEGSQAHSRGDFGAAIELYKKSIEADPGQPEVQYNLGVAYLDNHNYINASKQIQELKDMDQIEMADLLQGLWHEQMKL